jgi:hypothetical protein
VIGSVQSVKTNHCSVGDKKTPHPETTQVTHRSDTFAGEFFFSGANLSVSAYPSLAGLAGCVFDPQIIKWGNYIKS